MSNVIFTKSLKFLEAMSQYLVVGVLFFLRGTYHGINPWQEPFLPDIGGLAMENIYESIAARTGGNVYIGVVGPVRTGKSTLVKRLMEQLVIPNMDDPYRQERARDELPQSGSGKTIMTTEPKFVPEEAVEISPDGKTRLRIRMIDSVGYMVPGASGAEEEGKPRMVTTPWFDYEIPMTEAAELGTKKVMEDHCSIGLVVTTDGSITDIPRSDYAEGEGRAIRDMQATGKPFLVIVNSRDPKSEEAVELCDRIRREFGAEPVAADCQSLGKKEIGDLFARLLRAFPMQQLRIYMPRWLDALDREHPVKKAVYEKLLESAAGIRYLSDAEKALASLRDMEQVQEVYLRDTDLTTGIVSCVVRFPEQLFYEILSDGAGMPIRNDGQLLNLLVKFRKVQEDYDRISAALSAVRATGYGVVMPAPEEMKMEKPEVIKKGSTYGVKLRAAAPSIHMIRVDIDTQISPMVGDEQQSRDLIAYLTGEEPEKLWQSNIFGKTVYDLVQEGFSAKLIGLPEEVRGKFRGTLTKIVNDGARGLICLIL